MHRTTLSLVALSLVTLSLAACQPTRPTTTPDPATSSCDDFELDVERYWSSEKKAEVRAGILAANTSYGKIVAERVVTRMDAVTQDWVMMQEKVCKDTVVRKIMPVEVYNKVSACLLGNLAQQRQLVIVATAPRPDQVDLLESTIDEAGGDLRLCLETAVYSYYDTDQAEARELLAEAKVLRGVGDREGAEAAADQAKAKAEQSEALGLRVDVWVETGRDWVGDAKYEEARQLADLAMQTAKEGGYALGFADAAELRGRVDEKMADYAGALAHHREALAIREEVLGKDHPSTASAYHNIGAVHHRRGEYDEALQWYRKALAIREQVLGSDHPSTANSYNNIGLAYGAKGEYDEALQWYRKALAIWEKVLGSNHPSTATSYNNIGAAYDAKGEYDEALQWYRKALAIREKVLGSDHPDTAITYNNIGFAYDAKGEYDEALQWYLEALAIREQVLGKDHPDTATSFNSIGLAYVAKGEYDEALQWYRKALAIWEKVLGSDHPDTVITYNNIGLAHKKKGEYDEALKWYRKALAGCERVLGNDHPLTKTTRANLAALCNHHAPACSP